MKSRTALSTERFFFIGGMQVEIGVMPRDRIRVRKS